MGEERPNYLSELEYKVLLELSRAREDPPGFASEMEQKMASQYRGKIYHDKVAGIDIQTQEGKKAFDEAVACLKGLTPVGPLRPSYGLSIAAQDMVADQSTSGGMGHSGSDGSDPFSRMERYGEWQVTSGENISYGAGDAWNIVVGLIIDDGVPDRGHRENIFNREFKVVGIACGAHPKLRYVCVMDFAGGFKDSDSKIQNRPSTLASAYETARDKKVKVGITAHPAEAGEYTIEIGPRYSQTKCIICVVQ